MISRRKVIKRVSAIPLLGFIGASAIGNAAAMTGRENANLVSGAKLAKKAGKSIYESLGVRPVINGRGTVTIIGGSSRKWNKQCRKLLWTTLNWMN